MSRNLSKQDGFSEFVGIMVPQLNEKRRRIFLGALSQLLGHGGVTSLSELTGISRVTITNAKHEIKVLQNDPNTRPVAETTCSCKKCRSRPNLQNQNFGRFLKNCGSVFDLTA